MRSTGGGYTLRSAQQCSIVVYWYAHRNVWICVSDPTNSDIPALNPPPPPELWQPGDTNVSNNWLSTHLLVIILVAALVVGTAVLIRVFWKPNKGKR